jgi:transposase InsO family protein
MVDYYTKWTESISVPNHTVSTVADKLVTELFCRFGVCREIHSDQGREFESELFAAVCNKLGIEKTRTTPYRPQSDGLAVRVNRVLQEMLAIGMTI